jgi:uncharacterized protein YgiM (DUF1202 family)
MATEPVQNPPSLSKRLIKQWRWVAVTAVIFTLAIMSKSADINFGGGFDDTDRCQVEVTADVLNVRAGPGTDTEAVDKLSRGDTVDALPETTNGFRKLAENRWVSLDFVRSSTPCG